MTPYILSLVLFYSNLYGIDPKLTMSIIQVESAWNSNAIGKAGEVGLLQLHPKYFQYTKEYLKIPENNIRIGVKYLSQVKKECPHKVDRSFLICFNRGVVGGARIVNPKQDNYYKQVIKVYKHF